jgi:hypothetical protein
MQVGSKFEYRKKTMIDFILLFSFVVMICAPAAVEACLGKTRTHSEEYAEVATA